MSGKAKLRWLLLISIITSLLFVVIIPSISWADKINENINSSINEVGIKVGVKVFLKHLNKTLPKKIDDLTIFKNAEAKGSNIYFYYQALAPANKLDKKATEQSVTNFFRSKGCKDENTLFLLENGLSFSYIYMNKAILTPVNC